MISGLFRRRVQRTRRPARRQTGYDDRLTGIGTSVSYSYIGAGTDRYSKTVSGTTTDFLYENGSVDEEMQGSTVTADYGASAEKLNGTVSWMLQDEQGSTRQLLNSSQTVVASYISDAFGNSVGGSESSPNSFTWGISAPHGSFTCFAFSRWPLPVRPCFSVGAGFPAQTGY